MRERKGRRDSLRKERKKQYAVMYMYMNMYQLYKDAHKRICIQTPTGSRNGLENHMHTQTDITCTCIYKIYIYRVCTVFIYPCTMCVSVWHIDLWGPEAYSI